MSQRHAIAVDAGGTTTRAVVVDASGTCLAEAHGGPGNPRAAGGDAAAANIVDACMAAVEQTDVWPDIFVVTAAGVLSQGGDFPELHVALSQKGLDGLVRLEPDVLSAYFSATAAPTGSVLIVGTGTTAARITDSRVSAVRDGLGWLLGDGGAGFWIGHQVARAAARHLDQRGPATSLTQRVSAVAGELHADVPGRPPALSGLIDWAYSLAPVQLAQLTPLALDEANRGDAVARQICDEAADRVLGAVASLPGSGSGPVVVGGGVMGMDSPVAKRVRDELGDAALRVTDGVVGAALLAVGMLGGSPDEAHRQRVAASLQQVRG